MNTRFVDLRAKVEPLLKPFVRRIFVFGSYARGDAGYHSDVDLLVTLKPAERRPPLGLFEVIRLERELEKILGCTVDLVTEEGLDPRIRLKVDKDKVVLYEEI
jgi:predicted nucleotidyltransferase